MDGRRCDSRRMDEGTCIRSSFLRMVSFHGKNNVVLRINIIMNDIIQIVLVWPVVLAVELGIGLIFIWTARDKPQTPSS